MVNLAALMQTVMAGGKKRLFTILTSIHTAELLLDFHAVACFLVNVSSINNVCPTGVW